jgi:hypothetical protein
MGQKVYVKPGKTALKVGMFVSALFFLFGLFFINLLIGEPDSHIGIGFLIFWLLVVVLIFGTFWVQHVNYDQPNPGGFNPMINIDTDLNSNAIPISFDEKLRKLEELKKGKLISDTEYNQKRKEIMEEKW